jgi:two-component system response regulator FixJ
LAQTTQSPRRASIVIVEEDPSLRSALVFALEADGFDVQAYDRAAPLLSAPMQADCMVIDMKLPDVDGLILIFRLRRRGCSAPALLTMINPDHRARWAAEVMGVQIVANPLITGELRGRIDELLAANPVREGPSPSGRLRAQRHAHRFRQAIAPHFSQVGAVDHAPA